MKLFKSLKNNDRTHRRRNRIYGCRSRHRWPVCSKVSADSLPQQTDSNLNLDVKAAIAVDAKTGQILYAKNAEQALPVASMSKLMTIYLVLQAIKTAS